MKQIFLVLSIISSHIIDAAVLTGIHSQHLQPLVIIQPVYSRPLWGGAAVHRLIIPCESYESLIYKNRTSAETQGGIVGMREVLRLSKLVTKKTYLPLDQVATFSSVSMTFSRPYYLSLGLQYEESQGKEARHDLSTGRGRRGEGKSKLVHCKTVM